MTPKLDLTNCLNDTEVCSRLGIAPRTLHREVTEGRLHPQYRQREGKRPERVFFPDEIEARMPKAPAVLTHREPNSAMPPESPAMQPMPQSVAGMAGLPVETWAAIVNLVEGVIASAQPETPAMWIKLEEAARITGLSQRKLRQLIDIGKLGAIDDKWIKIERAALDTLDVRALLIQPKKATGGKKR